MLSFHAHLKVFVATAPCDLRMSFNGLWAALQKRLLISDADRRAIACADAPGERISRISEDMAAFPAMGDLLLLLVETGRNHLIPHDGTELLGARKI